MGILKPKIKEFATKYLENNQNNGTQIVKDVFKITDDNYAAVKASRLIRNVKVMEFFEDKAEPVAENMVRLALKAKAEQVQVNAGKDVLDRAGFKPIEKTQSVNLNVNAGIDNSKYKEIKAKFLKDLDALEQNE